MNTKMSSGAWLSNRDLAERFNVSVDTVRRWRLHGEGPTGVRIGKHVRYAVADVEAWEEQRRQEEDNRMASHTSS